MRFFITILFCLTITISSAKRKTLKSEIGISLFSYVVPIDNKYSSCDNGQLRLPFSKIKSSEGCIFPFNYYYPKVFFSTKLSQYFNFRTAIQFTKHQSESAQTAGIEHFAQVNRIAFSEGFQYNFFKAKRFNPYLAIDVILSYSDYSTKTINNNPLPHPWPITEYRHLEKYALSGLLSAGANYKINNRFSSSIEFGTDFSNGLFLPSRLSINYHF